MTGRLIAAMLGALLAAPVALAHITPPVVLASDREALVGLLQGGQRFFVREVRLTEAEREAVRARTGWRPDEDFHRFFLARSAGGQLVAAALFLTEFTVHGPVRVAVGLGADGRVRGVTVVELTEETYPWVKPLLDRQFTRAFIGHGPGDPAAPAAPAGEALESMPHFYGQVIAGLVHRAAVLHDVAIRRRGEAA